LVALSAQALAVTSSWAWQTMPRTSTRTAGPLPSATLGATRPPVATAISAGERRYHLHGVHRRRQGIAAIIGACAAGFTDALLTIRLRSAKPVVRRGRDLRRARRELESAARNDVVADAGATFAPRGRKIRFSCRGLAVVFGMDARSLQCVCVVASDSGQAVRAPI
jgi:hypothetical protein